MATPATASTARTAMTTSGRRFGVRGSSGVFTAPSSPPLRSVSARADLPPLRPLRFVETERAGPHAAAEVMPERRQGGVDVVEGGPDAEADEAAGPVGGVVL